MTNSSQFAQDLPVLALKISHPRKPFGIEQARMVGQILLAGHPLDGALQDSEIQGERVLGIAPRSRMSVPWRPGIQSHLQGIQSLHLIGQGHHSPSAITGHMSRPGMEGVVQSSSSFCPATAGLSQPGESLLCRYHQ